MHEAIIQMGGLILAILLLASFFFKLRAITKISIPTSSFISYLIRPVSIRKLKNEMPGLPVKVQGDIKNANYCLYAWYTGAVLIMIYIAYLVKTGMIFKLHNWL